MRKIKVSQVTRNSVASLSTGGAGSYYQHPSHWWGRLVAILEGEGMRPVSMMPVFYNEDGRLTMWLETLNGEDRIENVMLVVTYHRMVSYNWEIVCYLS